MLGPSTDDIELEKIKNERERLKNLSKSNKIVYEKSKQYSVLKPKPLPLTFIKPFNLSSNQNIMLKKKRIVNTNNDQINLFIKNLMERREEEVKEANNNLISTNQLMKSNNESKEVKEQTNKHKLSTIEKEYKSIISYPKFKAKKLSSKIFGGTTKVIKTNTSHFDSVLKTSKSESNLKVRQNDVRSTKVLLTF